MDNKYSRLLIGLRSVNLDREILNISVNRILIDISNDFKGVELTLGLLTWVKRIVEAKFEEHDFPAGVTVGRYSDSDKLISYTYLGDTDFCLAVAWAENHEIKAFVFYDKQVLAAKYSP